MPFISQDLLQQAICLIVENIELLDTKAKQLTRQRFSLQDVENANDLLDVALSLTKAVDELQMLQDKQQEFYIVCCDDEPITPDGGMILDVWTAETVTDFLNTACPEKHFHYEQVRLLTDEEMAAKISNFYLYGGDDDNEEA